MIGLKGILKKKYSTYSLIVYRRGLVWWLILLLIIFMGCSTKKETVQKPTVTETEHIVKKGENLEVILNNILSHQSTIEIINVLTSADFPFRKCFPGDSIKILKENGDFLKLTYSQNLTFKYYIFKNDDHLFVAMKYPYIDTVTCFLKGEVNSTLYESLLKTGETPILVFRYADIFAWEIDFVTETQNGDSFSIFFEKTFCDSNFVDYLNIIATTYKGNIGEYYGIYYCDQDGNEDYYNLKGESLRKSLLKSPLRFSYISSYFSNRRFHPILKVWRPHHGLDYAAPTGTPVSSIGHGTVTYKGWRGGYGNLVEIRHKNNFKTRYGHLSRFAKGLYKGKKIKMGELIGYVGSTGLSTGPHLHFEMYRKGVSINPLKVKIPRAPSVKKKYLSDFEQHRDSLLKYIEQLSQPVGEEISKE
jgi:murein DD-endopeptidase MepM/ murein hydrolase activator NlpD